MFVEFLNTVCIVVHRVLAGRKPQSFHKISVFSSLLTGNSTIKPKFNQEFVVIKIFFWTFSQAVVGFVKTDLLSVVVRINKK